MNQTLESLSQTFTLASAAGGGTTASLQDSGEPGRFASLMNAQSAPRAQSSEAQPVRGSGKTGASKRPGSARIRDSEAIAEASHNPTAIAVAELTSRSPAKATTQAALEAQYTESNRGDDPTPTTPKLETSREVIAHSNRAVSRQSARPSEQPASDRPQHPAATLPVSTPGAGPREIQVKDTGVQAEGPQSAASSQAAKPVGISLPAADSSAKPDTPLAGDRVVPAGRAPQSSQVAGSPSVKQAAQLIDQLAAKATRLGNQPRLTLAENNDKFAAQIGRGFAAALRQGGGSVTLRLQPEALGNLKVRLELAGSRVDARFEASTEQARGLLSHSMGSLKHALEARGWEVTALHVTVGEPPEPVTGSFQTAGDSNQPGGAGGDQQAGSGPGGWEHPPDRGRSGVESWPQIAGPEDQAGRESPRDAVMSTIESGGAPSAYVRLDALA